MKHLIFFYLIFIPIVTYSQTINVNATATERKIVWDGNSIVNQEVTRNEVKIVINAENLTIGSSTYPIIAIAKKKDGSGFQIYIKDESSSTYEFIIHSITFNTLYDKELSWKISPTMEYNWSWE